MPKTKPCLVPRPLAKVAFLGEVSSAGEGRPRRRRRRRNGPDVVPRPVVRFLPIFGLKLTGQAFNFVKALLQGNSANFIFFLENSGLFHGNSVFRQLYFENLLKSKTQGQIIQNPVVFATKLKFTATPVAAMYLPQKSPKRALYRIYYICCKPRVFTFLKQSLPKTKPYFHQNSSKILPKLKQKMLKLSFSEIWAPF